MFLHLFYLSVFTLYFKYCFVIFQHIYPFPPFIYNFWHILRSSPFVQRFLVLFFAEEEWKTRAKDIHNAGLRRSPKQTPAGKKVLKNKIIFHKSNIKNLQICTLKICKYIKNVQICTLKICKYIKKSQIH